MSLGTWIAQAIENSPEPPDDIDAETARISAALARLEERVTHSDEHIDHLIRPLSEEVDRLAEEAEQVVHPTHREDIPGRDPHAGDVVHVDAEHYHPPEERRLPRITAAIGAVALLVIGAGIWLWLWQSQEQTVPVPGTSTVKVATPPPSADQTPPPGAAVPLPALAAPTFVETAPLPSTPAEALALRDRANRDDTDAAYALGVALLEGHSVPQNVREAGEWLATAATAGNPKAQYRLARLYETGTGFVRNPAQAFFWMQAAAEQGITEAAYELGAIYAQGQGVPRSYALAARWYREAAKKDNRDALYALGQIYELGLDVRKSTARALEYYRRAAQAGSKAAADRITALAAAANSIKSLPPAPDPNAPIRRESAPVPAPGAALTRPEIAEIERLLAQLDLAPGPADGTVDRQTVAAIRLFQQMGGMPEDGRPSRALLRQLREVAGKVDDRSR